VGAWVFISGRGPIDMDAHKIVGKTITEQVAKTRENIRVLLQAANCAMDDSVKLTAYLKDISDFDAYNGSLSHFFHEAVPGSYHGTGGLDFRLDRIARMQLQHGVHIPLIRRASGLLICSECKRCQVCR
jgi:enamine deaminase RidA (YjgF/YER057c/UK114 family)